MTEDEIPIKLFSNITTDFINQGIIHEMGDHVYFQVKNTFTLRTYIFHMPKKLFETMIEKRIISVGTPEILDMNEKLRLELEKEQQEKEKMNARMFQ